MPATDDTYTIASGADLWAGRDAPIPAWVPSTLFEAALAPMTNSPADIEQRGVWSSPRVGLGPILEYSGGAYNPHMGTRGALLVHGGGHSATEDNCIIAANFNTLAWEMVFAPSDLQAASKWVNYVTEGPTEAATAYRNSYGYFIAEGSNSTGWADPLNAALHENPSPNYGEVLPNIPGSAHTYGKLLLLPPDMAGDPKGGLLRPVASAVGFTVAGGFLRGHLYKIDAQEWVHWGYRSTFW